MMGHNKKLRSGSQGAWVPLAIYPLPHESQPSTNIIGQPFVQVIFCAGCKIELEVLCLVLFNLLCFFDTFSGAPFFEISQSLGPLHSILPLTILILGAFLNLKINISTLVLNVYKHIQKKELFNFQALSLICTLKCTLVLRAIHLNVHWLQGLYT